MHATADTPGPQAQPEELEEEEEEEEKEEEEDISLARNHDANTKRNRNECRDWEATATIILLNFQYSHTAEMREKVPGFWDSMHLTKQKSVRNPRRAWLGTTA